jgi:uncharacterized protein (DUF2252 family)
LTVRLSRDSSDVKRLAASLSVASRDRGLSAGERRDAVTAAVRAYRQAMAGFAAMRETPCEQAVSRTSVLSQLA